MDEPKTVGDLFARLLGHGVYDDTLAHELDRFGFSYADGVLSYAGRSEKLYVRKATQVAIDMSHDKSGGMLNNDIPDDLLMIDALDFSVAVFKLMAPGQTVPSSMYIGRGKGFQKNVEAIDRLEATNAKTRKANHLN
jgi:hypothetical protein